MSLLHSCGGLALGLYVVLFGIITTTQPQLALGGASLLATLAVAGWLWTRKSR